MVKATWQFETDHPRGGAASGAWSNQLTGAELSAETILAREAIQNSTDAELPGSKVRIDFTRYRLSPAERDRHAKILDFASGPLPRLAQLGLSPGNFYDLVQQGSNQPAGALLIQDFHTLGLGGRLHEGHEEDDRFRRLVFVLGAEGTPHETRGGSFGFGKTAYSGASNVRTVIYYSRFASTEATQDVSARLFVASFFRDHKVDGTNYTGRAWFGAVDENGEPWPFIDDDAHAMAEELGIPVRSSDATGTSVLVLGNDYDLDDLRKGIEDYWWPRILENNLEVHLMDGDEEVEPPNIRTRTDLRPYIHAYEMAVGRAQPQGDNERCTDMRTYPFQGKDVKLGKWAAVQIEEVLEQPADPEEDSEDTLSNAICLMRKPRMVVEYMAPSHNTIPIAAVYVADEAIDNALRFSEPPPHHKWDYRSDRLKNIADGANLVQGLLKRLRYQITVFQNTLIPAPPRPSLEPLNVLGRILADLLGGTKPSKPGPIPRHPDPFEINVEQSRHTSTSGTHIHGAFKLGLKADHAEEMLPVDVVITVSVLAEDNAQHDQLVSLQSLSLEGKAIDANPLRVNLLKDKHIHIEAQSDPINPEWQAELSIDVTAAATQPELT